MRFRNSAAMIAATIAIGLFSQAASAADSFSRHHHQPSFHGWHIRSGNFYSNWNSVHHVRGVGTYVVSNGSYVSDPGPCVVQAPSYGAKIIDVASEGNACSYENGVCVIRGTN